MEMVDLSVLIDENLEPYDGDPKIEIIRSLDKDGYELSMVKATMHNGTHIDVKKHMFDGKNICDYDISKFILKAVVSENIDKFSDAVIIPMSRKLNIDEAKRIVDNNVKMLIIDDDSPDDYPFVVHKYLLQNDVIIVENACNLEKIKDWEDFYIIALPLRIKAEASLTRLVAIKK